MRRRTYASDLRAMERARRRSARMARHRALAERAGLREIRLRRNGATVGVYDGSAAGLDTTTGRWSTVCEDHSEAVSHRTLALARLHAVTPEEWCSRCHGVGCPAATGEPTCICGVWEAEYRARG